MLFVGYSQTNLVYEEKTKYLKPLGGTLKLMRGEKSHEVSQYTIQGYVYPFLKLSKFSSDDSFTAQ